MNRESEQEKIALEHGAAKLFLRCCEKQFGVSMRNIWHNTPSKPDVSCYKGDERLDIEVAHLYASETEAMAVLGRPLSISMQRDLAEMALAPSNERLHCALHRLLAQKAKKHYESTQPWLLIRNASTIWHLDDFKSVLTHLDVPKHHPFQQIWLLCDFYRGELLQIL